MIKIICVGKVKEEYFRSAIVEYLKRISKYSKIEVIEVPDYALGTPILNMEHESKDILKNVDKKDYVITLEIGGTELNSVEFSKKINDTLLFNSNITFIIGGSDGLAASVKNISNYRLSFSRMNKFLSAIMKTR